jgi:hypothetical protein
VQPFLQDAEPDSIKILWETDGGSNHNVEWGTSVDNLNQMAIATSNSSQGSNIIHNALITGLLTDSRYYYRVTSETDTSAIYDFITPPTKSSELSFNLIAMSDMQRDGSNPDKFQEIVHDGIIDFIEDKYSTDIPSHLAFVMIPGDLVVTGTNYSQWKDHFFDPASPLFSQIPVYPVPGNHENNSTYYFQYFSLPNNGTVGFEEHWWYKDYSNVRIIGIDSNSGYRIQSQLDWLSTVLDGACIDPDIDFVFVQLHHPHKSELWTPGELDYTGDIIQLMESFTSDCSKPSIHFFGHTHGYSRGQSRDHEHLWVNVATAGGAIDYWGAFPNADYEEFVQSIDEYGFVFVEVEAGNDAQFKLKRISRGDESNQLDNIQQDSIVIKKTDAAPQKPLGIFPNSETVSPDCINFQASSFIDPGDIHQASHWQIFKGCEDFTNPVLESWKQNENWYNEENTQADDFLDDEEFTNLDENLEHCWRVRYRDEHLKWSEWSDPVSFTTSASEITANLLLNPGGEDATNNWTVQTGSIESLGSGECAGTSPHSGSKYLAVGGLCDGNETSYSEAYQDVDVSAFSTSIDNGNAEVVFGGFLSNFSGSDQPTMNLEYLDSGDSEISSSTILTTLNSSWTDLQAIENIPFSTRTIRVVLTGTRNSGTDNDSYFDDLSIKLDTVAGSQCSSIVSLNLISFEADCDGDKTKIQWKVAEERNIYKYQLQRSLDNKNWFEIEELKASAIAQPIKIYSFKSWDYLKGVKYLYRLKIYELDGSYSYSDIITAKCGKLNPKVNAFPNPITEDQLKLIIQNPNNARFDMSVINVLGQSVFTQILELQEGEQQLELTTKSWPSGLYTINLKGLDWQWSEKLIKQ